MKSRHNNKLNNYMRKNTNGNIIQRIKSNAKKNKYINNGPIYI